MFFSKKKTPLVMTLTYQDKEGMSKTKNFVHELPNRETALLVAKDKESELSELESGTISQETIDNLFNSDYERVFIVYSKEIKAYSGPGDCVYFLVEKNGFIGLPGFLKDEYTVYSSLPIKDALRRVIKNVMDGKFKKGLNF